MEIGMNYAGVGTALLDDVRGVKIPSIVGANFGNPNMINIDILRQWIQTAKKEHCTWRVLVDTLMNNGCVALAEDIKDSLGMMVIG